jgi:hypothetical protein
MILLPCFGRKGLVYENMMHGVKVRLNEDRRGITLHNLPFIIGAGVVQSV